MNQYTPVSCAVYANFELAILRRSPIRICWRGRGGWIRMDAAVPINIRTRCHGEFLLMRKHSGAVLAIRLDRILRSVVL